ncbi:hemolysin family protein [Planctomicrobium sp. SH664]|uniref:hemolysin family protein n=1 Tax=Planctomicrobium sp. SH664 TaxID=3448125 RepID=UPI003F5B0E56
MATTIISFCCFLAAIFFSTVLDSLRNFWRSRLAYVCRSRKNETRFGEILRDDEQALQACATARLVTLVCAVALATAGKFTSGELTTQGLLIFLLGALSLCWLLLIVFPWTISRVAAEYVLYYCWPLIHLVTWLLSPLLRLTRRIDTLMHRIAGRSDPEPDNLENFAEEIQSVVDEGEREGILETRAGKMIQRVMELEQDDVRTVMTPRTDIISIQADCSLAQAREQLLEAGHSRIPVVEGSPDNIIGILYARDLLEQIHSPEQKQLREIVRSPFYVPETTTIDSLLDRMKREGLHLAIVLDEFGGVTGLVTLEDILEEIVGDIADEFDEREEDRYQLLDPHTLRVDARLHLDELNDLFDLSLPEDRDFDTIGGLVFSELGRVPKQGEEIEWQGVKIKVVEATDRKLIWLEMYQSVPWPQPDLQKRPLSSQPKSPADFPAAPPPLAD